MFFLHTYVHVLLSSILTFSLHLPFYNSAMLFFLLPFAIKILLYVIIVISDYRDYQYVVVTFSIPLTFYCATMLRVTFSYEDKNSILSQLSLTTFS